MGINATLFGQMATFVVFVWFMMKFVWPPIMRAMDERQKKIADGLAAADKSRKELDEARGQSQDIVREARSQAGEIVENANQRGTQMVEEAKRDAQKERERLRLAGEADIANEVQKAKDALRTQVAALAVAGAEKLIGREIDQDRHRALLDALIAEI